MLNRTTWDQKNEEIGEPRRKSFLKCREREVAQGGKRLFSLGINVTDRYSSAVTKKKKDGGPS